MKRALVVLLILSLSRIGVAYADTANSNNLQNYFFGTKTAQANLNQVLALLVGPEGKPGPAGVAGKDGLIGLNGRDGKDGLNGAPGIAGIPGQDGTSVVASAFTGVQGNCTSGGVKFTSGNGDVTYACNGASGSQGPVGPIGATGPAGTGGGGTLGYGQGEVQATGCEADGKIVINFDRIFTGSDFVFSRFNLGDPTVTSGDIKDTCAGKVVGIYFKIGPAPLKNPSAYATGNIIRCRYTLPGAAGWPMTKWQFSKGASDLTCVNISNGNSSLSFDAISTADFTDSIGFEVG